MQFACRAGPGATSPYIFLCLSVLEKFAVAMFANMSQAEQEFLDKLQKNEATLRDEILVMKQMLNQMGTGATGSGNGG